MQDRGWLTKSSGPQKCCYMHVESFKIDIETFVTIPVSTNPF